MNNTASDSDPNPPDIRPFGRIQTSVPNDPAVAGSPQPTASRPSRLGPVTSKTRVTTTLALITLAALCTIPIATATGVVPNHDKFSLPPGCAASPPGGTSSHRTPILSFLKQVGSWVLTSVFYAAGYQQNGASGAAITCASPVARIGKREEVVMDSKHIVMACMVPVLVCLSGVFAGLTLGYFSVDQTQLHVLSISGTPKQQEYARRIMPVRKDSHLLLTTLILGNMIVNEALPVVMDPLFGGGKGAVYAVIVSTALVVIFAEIIPQSVCSRFGLAIGATMAPVVRVLIWIFFPIAWPVAKLLQYILGAHHGIIYRRSELRELIKMHAASGGGGGDLDGDTVTMAQGALDLAGKTAKDAMTPIDNVFMLPIEAKLDYETLCNVVASGHSRIPVYQMVSVPDINLTRPDAGAPKNKMVKKVIGSMLVKSCVLLDPEDATPLASLPLNSIPSVPYNEPLTNMLNAFQEGRSHMAIVSRRGRVGADPTDAESVMTAAAGGLRQKFMRKVAEISHGGKSNTSGSEEDSDSDDVEQGKKHKIFRRKSVSTSTSTSPTTTPQSNAEKFKIEAQQEASAATDTEKWRITTPKLTQLDQAVPADAALPPENLEQFYEGLEGAPLGIITLEDVVEELIGEEIYDEYDNDGPKNAASSFVPREAAMAARKAMLDRQTTTQPEEPSTGLTRRGSDSLSQPAKRRPKFAIGKGRSNSQPGRPRTAVAPMKPAATPCPPADASTPPARAESTGALQVLARDTTTKGGNGDNESATPTPPNGPATPALTTAPSASNLLNEALTVERNRRRAAAGVQSMVRGNSSTGVSRVPSRTASPAPVPTSGATPVDSTAVATAPLAGAPVAPVPKRPKKFKSVSIGDLPAKPKAAAAAVPAPAPAPSVRISTPLGRNGVAAAPVTSPVMEGVEPGEPATLDLDSIVAEDLKKS